MNDKIYNHLKNKITILLNQNNYKEIYKILYIHKYNYIGGIKYKISAKERKKIKQIIIKKKSFKLLFKFYYRFIRYKGKIPNNKKMFILYLSNNINNNQNYLISNDDLIDFNNRIYFKNFGKVKYRYKSFFYSPINYIFGRFLNNNYKFLKHGDYIYYINRDIYGTYL